jgi:hypothetical protein
MMTNSDYAETAIQLIRDNPVITSVGVHVNLTKGQPVSGLNNSYLDEDGNWIEAKVKNLLLLPLDKQVANEFKKEISSQIEIAIDHGIHITHLDSHHHVHTLPSLFNFFISASKKYNLKLRLAQTYSTGSLLKYAYRVLLNNKIKRAGINYSEYFEFPDRFISTAGQFSTMRNVEVMLHPVFDENQKLTDGHDPAGFKRWIEMTQQELTFETLAGLSIS